MRIIWSEIAQATFVRFMADQAGMMAVNRAVEALADDPAPLGAFVRGAYRRLRVGPYRVLPPRAHGIRRRERHGRSASTLLGDQAQLSRPGDGLRAVGRTKLVQDMADMLFDGVDGNDKLPGDSLV